MKDIDILFELYKEQRALGIHHETQRSTVSSLLLTIAAILIGFITYDKDLTLSDLPATGTVIIIGIFGCLFTLKNYERFKFHRARSRKYRLAIDAALRYNELHDGEDREIRNEIRKALKLYTDNSDCLIKSLVDMANNEYNKKGNFLAKTDLHKFWTGLHLIISVIGVFIGLSIIKSQMGFV